MIWEGQVTAMIHIKNQTHSIAERFTPGQSLIDFTQYKITLAEVKPDHPSGNLSDYAAMLIISDLHEESACKNGTMSADGICASSDQDSKDSSGANPNIRIEDSAFARQSLQTSETISEVGTLTSTIIENMGAILIVFFIIIFTIKKRLVKADDQEI